MTDEPIWCDKELTTFAVEEFQPSSWGQVHVLPGGDHGHLVSGGTPMRKKDATWAPFFPDPPGPDPRPEDDQQWDADVDPGEAR